MDKKLALLLLCLMHGVLADVMVLRDVTLGFGEALEFCREESQLTEDKMEEFFHIWNNDFKFEHRELGCAIQCMSRHFNLLTDTSRMHHENTHKFIESFPNGHLLARRMVDIIHNCEQQFNDEPDHCWRVLHEVECFKHACLEQGIAPGVEMMLTEFIMESEA